MDPFDQTRRESQKKAQQSTTRVGLCAFPGNFYERQLSRKRRL